MSPINKQEFAGMKYNFNDFAADICKLSSKIYTFKEEFFRNRCIKIDNIEFKKFEVVFLWDIAKPVNDCCSVTLRRFKPVLKRIVELIYPKAAC